MDTLIATLLIWIGTHSSYDVSNMIHPTVILLDPQEITAEYYEGSGVALPESGIDERIFALYRFKDVPRGTIYLLDPRTTAEQLSAQPDGLNITSDLTEQTEADWLDDPVFQERLLHELIHHVQYQSGATSTFPCPAFGEKEAYLLGGGFLAQRYARDPLPNRKVLAHMYSRC